MTTKQYAKIWKQNIHIIKNFKQHLQTAKPSNEMSRQQNFQNLEATNILTLTLHLSNNWHWIDNRLMWKSPLVSYDLIFTGFSQNQLTLIPHWVYLSTPSKKPKSPEDPFSSCSFPEIKTATKPRYGNSIPQKQDQVSLGSKWLEVLPACFLAGCRSQRNL